MRALLAPVEITPTVRRVKYVVVRDGELTLVDVLTDPSAAVEAIDNSSPWASDGKPTHVIVTERSGVVHQCCFAVNAIVEWIS